MKLVKGAWYIVEKVHSAGHSYAALYGQRVQYVRTPDLATNVVEVQPLGEEELRFVWLIDLVPCQAMTNEEGLLYLKKEEYV
jgi:hypothetical protein